ncbi:hypothetical protein H2200_011533 [Cladophialophora chaetospira]|uniref:CENP-V/GFA domain-containing protein n=1 Tax=Cladophialophora chaetospira TaxID=386627 RepID=A0AA39CD87_9EURO|nr:hypothetical protein H2200_011533 [Cladophialophora chaetospira]
MPTGSCYCGNLRIEYTGEPITTALCHCSNCKNYTGSTYSLNYLIPSENFKIISGTPKEISKIADSGKSITNCFCPDCGTMMFRYGDTFGGKDGAKVLQAGVLDDEGVVDNTGLVDELFVGRRAGFQREASGVRQNEGMPQQPRKEGKNDSG